MEIKGVLERKVGEKTGTSASTGNEWMAQEWLIVIPGNRTKHVKVDVRGKDRCKQWDDFFAGMPDKNAPVVVKFEIDAHEYNGKWFNTIDAWDISMATGW